MADKEQTAILRLQEASRMSLTYYEQPLIITTSGGKDSDICLALAKRAGILYEVQHDHTTADAPQTVQHVRDTFRRLKLSGVQCTINYPIFKGKRTSLWDLMPQKLMPPTRLARYCCEVLKERSGKNRMITTGVRWEESTKRQNSRGIFEKTARNAQDRIILNNDNDDKRQLFENCRMKARRVCNPIVDWTHRDVWDYIQAEQIPMNPLYDMGFDRVGCIGCPMANAGRYFEFRLFPAYEQMYRKAFDRIVAARKLEGKPCEDDWSTGERMFAWWMREDYDQLTMEQWVEIQAAVEGEDE